MFPRHSVITKDLYTEGSVQTNARLLFQSAQIELITHFLKFNIYGTVHRNNILI